MDKFTIYFFTLFVFLSCSKSEKEFPKDDDEKLFSFLPSSYTGISFQNKVSQDGNLNVLSYNYLFNGGGVAIGDFNNDTLPDIFFTGNQVEDRLYLNLGELKFRNIGKSSGINVNRTKNGLFSWSSGVTTVDINNDGYLDIYVCKSGPFKSKQIRANQLFVNNGDLTFTERGQEYGIDDTGYSTQASFFDFDRDGDSDLYVLNHSVLFNQNRKNLQALVKNKDFVNSQSGHFYRNENGKFIDVTEKVGVLNFGFGLGLCASDLNDDGYIDFYVSNDYSEPDFMYINSGNGTFQNQIKSRTSHISFYGMGCDIADFNNDILHDVCVLDMTPANNYRSKANMASMNIEGFRELVEDFNFPYQYMINSLQLNQGNGYFSEISQMAGLDKTDWSWATLFADFDLDGYKDNFISNGYRYDVMEKDFISAMKTRNKELKSAGAKMTYEEKEEWLKKLKSRKLPNYFFKNTADLKFEHFNQYWGAEEVSHSNGAAYADLDLDGDLDLVVSNIDEKPFLYRNNANEGLEKNNWIQIQLEGTPLNRLGLNAKVVIISDGLEQMQELTLTRGYQSSVEPILTFGLGKATEVDTIKIIWSDGTAQILDKGITLNKRISIKKQSQIYPKEQEKRAFYFRDVTQTVQLFHRHEENIYDDFEKELLLPHKNSMHGPSLAAGDVNGDGLDDFFIGGAAGFAGQLYIQQSNNLFIPEKRQPWEKDKSSEDIDALFFDADGDTDLDLYVVSGGNEFSEGDYALQDRLYINNGRGDFTSSKNMLPPLKSSGSVVKTIDINNDKKPDLFIGGRMIPGKYPFPDKSYFLLNKGNKFEDITESFAPELMNLGMITDALSCDIDGNGFSDLIVVGEGMSMRIFKNNGSNLYEDTPKEIAVKTGWWNSVEAADLDNDGDLDFVLGNLGLNYKYKASETEPFKIYANDFDKNGNIDIVLGYYNEGTCYPLRGRQCSSEQMPFIKEKFPTYDAFAKASINEVYGNSLSESKILEATNFASCVILNNGEGNYSFSELPKLAQISCINDFLVEDFNTDGIPDLLIAGNLFAAEIETPRNDAGTGLILIGDGSGNFTPVPPHKSGFFANRDVKRLALMNAGKGRKFILISNNNDFLQIFALFKSS